MPLSEPGGGIDRANFIARNTVFSDGNDTSINFVASDYDPVNEQFLIGGNNSFCGLMPPNKNKIAQFAALPSTVITGGTIEDIAFSGVDDGVLVRIGNQYARSSDGGATWVAITPAAVVTYRGVISWKDNQIVAGAANGSIDWFISTDNGASYPSQRNIFSATVQFFMKNPAETIFMSCHTGADLAITSDDDLATATIQTVDLSAMASDPWTPTENVDAGSISNNGQEIVVGSNNGRIAISTDAGATFIGFPEDDNFFRNATSFRAIDYIQWVDALQGFFIGTTDQHAFIPGNSTLTTMNPVYMIGISNPGYTTSRNSYASSDGTNLVICANTNIIFTTLAP